MLAIGSCLASRLVDKDDVWYPDPNADVWLDGRALGLDGGLLFPSG